MEKFVFVGTKDGNDNTELIDMLDGRSAAHGQEIELSESEVESLKAGGVKLRKVGDSEASDDSEPGAEDASASEEGDSKSGLFGSR
jgi:hypothetical protein